MKIRQKIAGALVLALGLAMGGPAFAADAPEPLDFGNESGEGINGYSVQKYNQKGLSTSCIKGIVKVRQDALDSNIKWPERDGDMTITEYMEQEGITKEEYLNPQWSNNLEHVAMERAAEQSLHGYPFFFRVNGDWNTLSITRPPVVGPAQPPERSAMAAWNYETSCGATIRQLGEEKKGWAGDEDLQNKAFNYQTLVNPKLRSYGIAQIEDSHKYGNTQNTTNLWFGAAMSNVDEDTSGTEIVGTYTVHVKVHPDILNRVVATPTKVPQYLETASRVSDKEVPFFQDKLWLVGTWSSLDEAMATVTDDNKIKGLIPGEVDMAFTTDTGETQVFPFIVTASTITAVTNPEGVTTASGEAPVLPATVAGTVESDGQETATQLDVTWDEVSEADYSVREGGTFTVNGTVKGWADPVSIEVTVTPASITAVDPATSEVTTESGTAPALPANVQATWSNGDTSTEAVTWDAIDEAAYSAREGGSFTVAGAVEGWDQGVTANVTVNPATKTSAVNPAGVTTLEAVAPELPETVTVNWSNGDTSDEAVTWDAVSEDEYAVGPKTFTVNGTVEGIEEPVTVDVTVDPAVVSSIQWDSSQTVPSGGEAADLPATALVDWTNGVQTEEPITWDSYDTELLNAREGAEITVNGHIDASEEPLSYTIYVDPAFVSAAADIEETSTYAGTAPVLAEKVMVTWSNGDTSEEMITWNEMAADDYAEAGEFMATGMVGDVEVTQKVVVMANAAESVAALDGVTTEAGTAPVLAEKAMVTWANGEVTEEMITWNEIAAEDYAAAGEFTATGTVAGLEITQMVTVTEAADEPTEDPSDQPTDEPTKPADPGKGDHPKADPKKPHDGKKYGNSLPHTGADIALLGLISFLLIGAGTELTRRYVRSR